MRLAPPRTIEAHFRLDRLAAITLTIGTPILALALAAVKLFVSPDMNWRDVWVPSLCLACLTPLAWGQAYLARWVNYRRARRSGRITDA